MSRSTTEVISYPPNHVVMRLTRVMNLGIEPRILVFEGQGALLLSPVKFVINDFTLIIYLINYCIEICYSSARSLKIRDATFYKNVSI